MMTNKEIIEILQKEFPKFTKIQMSMVNHPDEYGVVLSPKARRLLRKKPEIKVKDTDKGKRKQLTIRIPNEDYDKLKALLDATECDTIQELVTDILLMKVKETE